MIKALEKIPTENIEADPTEKIIRKMALLKKDPNIPDIIKKSMYPPNGSNSSNCFRKTQNS